MDRAATQLPVELTVEAVLEAALAEWGLAAAAVEPLAGDVSHRRYFRLSDGGLPATAVAMLTPPVELPKMHDWVAIGGWLASQGVAVPRTLRQSDALAALLIDDVGDRLLCYETEPLAWTGQVVDDLVGLETAPASLTSAHRRRLEPERIRWELRRFRKVVAAVVAELDDAERVAWKAGEDALVAGLCGGRQVWMHRDLHSRNLLIAGDRVWWIDFQDAMIGPWLYDLASLAIDPYAALDSASRAALREHYLGHAGRVHPEATAAEIEAHWERALVQRLIHCVACYVWVYEHEGRPLYLRYLPYALARLREALEACPEAAPLAGVMAARWAALAARWSDHV